MPAQLICRKKTFVGQFENSGGAAKNVDLRHSDIAYLAAKLD
jgi:hypothetical protein